MNALATDQADRINDLLLTDPALDQVTAGPLHRRPGRRPSTSGSDTRRADMRRTPPDILITNYKMLDLLLQRAEDAPLWKDADSAYVVVDEFHTYDGAQGTDVAMLLRRLAAARRDVRAGPAARPDLPGRHLRDPRRGRRPDGGQRMLRRGRRRCSASEFDRDAVVGEDRQRSTSSSRSDDFDPVLPLPLPEELAALADPTRDDEALADLARRSPGSRTDPFGSARR